MLFQSPYLISQYCRGLKIKYLDRVVHLATFFLNNFLWVLLVELHIDSQERIDCFLVFRAELVSDRTNFLRNCCRRDAIGFVVCELLLTTTICLTNRLFE